jgi:hypothetical protein
MWSLSANRPAGLQPTSAFEGPRWRPLLGSGVAVLEQLALAARFARFGYARGDRPHYLLSTYAMTRALAPLTVPALLSLLSLPATAQFSDAWARFVPAPELLSSTVISAPDTETDLAWEDLDGNGRTDLVIVRKEPILGAGGRRNVLLLNEGGVLVNRTATHATQSDVAGDTGFLTPTTDADVVIADVTGDGLPDVVTSTSISDGGPKHITHPRVYRNLGSGGGAWGGIGYENARIPQLVHATLGTLVNPRFNGVSAGDLNADGAVDLYFVDMDQEPGFFSPAETPAEDADDRLLYNDGSGFFTDVSQLAMPSAWLVSGFANSCEIADFNLDGALDALKQTSKSGPATAYVTYNDASSAGTFVNQVGVYSGSPYFVSTGDLNNDGRSDIIVSENGKDGIVYNLATLPSGLASFSSLQQFDFLSGGDDSFASNSLATDLDGDGWNDVLICDVDPELPGYGRRMHVYHNRGGTVGGTDILLREERETSDDDDWVGVDGLTADDYRGTHDVAVFDVDGDGDKDMVISRFEGTYVWRQVAAPVCQTDLGFGHQTGEAVLRVCGGDLSAGNDAVMELLNGPPSQPAFLVAAASSNPVVVPLYHTIFAAQPPLFILPLLTDANGDLALPVPGGIGPLTVVIQFVVEHPNPLATDLVSNAVLVDFLP